jgi:hypothetical protein
MRKGLITPIPQASLSRDEGWLDIEGAAVVEVTSEEKEYPVESALVSRETQGWRAADSGSQTIRLIFDEPQRLTRISLVFEETGTERTQEFVLRWSSDGGRSFREIVRQQWNFSPPETIREIEEYQVELSDVNVLGNSDSVVGEQNGKEQSFLPPVIVSHRSSPSRVALRRARKRRALDRSGPLRTRSTMEGMTGTERPPTMLRRFPLWENLN